MADKKSKVQKVKGRPLLHWVGKKPIETIQSYPAQLVETVGEAKMLEIPAYDALNDSWSDLLFHGDNKEILSTLLVNGFRGKVDLIYIDPPFDSKADYVRKVELRGTKHKLAGEDQTAIEQIQYEDIWANDTYLQFMYERLILLRELLSEKGTIYLHCDWHKSHYLRMLMDEVFGANNFRNEVIWAYFVSGKYPEYYARDHDNIFVYSKSDTPTFNYKRHFDKYFYYEKYHEGAVAKDEKGNEYYLYNGERRTFDKQLSETWHINKVKRDGSEISGYPTQKPLELLERLIEAASNKNDIVLDCFVGSGTTAVAAHKLGRRWIGADINKGAIQTTMSRLQKSDIPSNVLHYRVNNYDFQQMSALRAIIVEKYGITESKTDLYFDGVVGNKLVKIAELNRPITQLDVQGITDELRRRADETRDVLLIGSGEELNVEVMLQENRRLQGSLNNIEVKDIQSDGIIIAEPAEADVSIEKSDGKVRITIKNYLSPTIIKRLGLDRSIFGERITDFRAQIDTVIIDTDYDGKTLNVTHADVPDRKQDFVQGEYEYDLPKASQKIAVKITDMLGEETLVLG